MSIKSFKGFDKDLKCRGYQFEIGKEYEEPEAKACDRGFHACEQPLDVFAYYPPATSRYCEVEQSGDLDRKGDDSKVASTRIKIGAELGITGIVRAQIEYVKAHANAEKKKAGDHGVSSAGEGGVSSAGEYGVSSAGWHGVSSAGEGGVSSAGWHGVSSAGWHGVSSAGEGGVSSAGDHGVSSSGGKSAAGEQGLAVARGNGVQVKGGLGAVLVLCEENMSNYDVAAYKVEVVDGQRIKADTWYKLVNGEFEEVKE